jgi:hypothetical protein
MVQNNIPNDAVHKRCHSFKGLCRARAATHKKSLGSFLRALVRSNLKEIKKGGVGGIPPTMPQTLYNLQVAL